MSDTTATPKQVAYLTYMGVSEAASLTKREASDRIDKLMEVESQETWAWLYERQGEWITDRFILHPDLYASEFRQFLDTQLPDVMHTYVRGRVTGASETLTKTKIRKVIHAITAKDREWWRAPNKKEYFFEELSVMYPGCCDGGQPARQPRTATPRIEQMRFSAFDHRNLHSLFRHYAEYCEPWEVNFVEGGRSFSPHDWLNILDSESLNAAICEWRSDSSNATYTIEVRRFLRTVRLEFAASWHPERHGWADSGPGSRTVHYYVPRAWMTDPPYTSEGLLVSLCKKSWISNDSPFYSVDPSRSFCRACSTHHENWNSQAT